MGNFFKRINANRYTILLLLLVSSFLSFSQQAVLSVTDVISQFFAARQAIQQSKLYLHLDKPYYSAGDSIWFKGYLVNSTTHTTSLLDNFIYVELLSRRDSVVFKKKIRKEDNIFQGCIPIDAVFPAGEYTIRAYTNWMRNADNDFFYSRNIKIANPIDASIQSAVEYEHAETGETTVLIVYWASDKIPYSEKQIKYSICTQTGEKLKEKTIRTDENGYIRIPMKTADSEKKLHIDTEFVDDEISYAKTFYIPDFSTDFMLTFFPEGGDLMEETRQLLAFKCQQSNGYSLEVNGFIQDQQGDTITSFSTEHDGMGCISFYAEKGKSYRATAISEDGTRKQFDLPQAKENGFSLALVQSTGKLHYQIKTSPSTEWPDSLFLVGHTRGYLMFVFPVSKGNETGMIDLHNLPEGITHFILSDKNGSALTERLAFIYPEESLTWKVSPNKPLYERRDKVSLSVQLQTQDNVPVSGDFSISVTDNRAVIPDMLADNILSNLLLTSDLKGYIENPGYYFTEKNRKTLRGLDLVMMTHGWRRFNVKDFNEEVENPSYFIEKGQFISGRIKNFVGKGAKNASIVAAAMNHNFAKFLTTNEKGEFVLDDMEYVDSTMFVIQARTKGGLALVEIEMDAETFPEVKNKNLFTDTLFHFNDNYLLFSSEKYYNEGGERVVNLKEVVIRGKQSKESKEEAERVWADYSMSPEMLEKSLVRSAQELFRDAMGGAELETPLVVLDGMCCWDDNYILSTIYPEDILTFDLYKDQSKCPYGSPSKSGPAVVITLKPEAMNRKKQGIALFQSLGYAQSVEFYHPIYDTPEKKANQLPDIRTTVYWNPKLSIDETGMTNVEFYTTDSPTSYNIEIEGVTTEGKVCRYTGNLYRK